MKQVTHKKITFVTRHYPPNPNINGESAWDMVKYLHEKFGQESNIICIDRKSDGGGEKRETIGNVIRLKPFSENKNAFFRFISFLYEGYKLIKTAKKYKDTTIICTTSPPLLPFWSNLLLGKKFHWGIWFFDLFPEFFSANNTISKKNPLFKWVLKKTYKKAPDFLIALGPQQAKHLQQKYNKQIPFLTLPCGVFFYQDKSTEKPKWWQDDKIILGYCGNIGQAHSPEFLKTVIDNFDPDKYKIVLALYGEHAEELKKYAKGKKGIILVDNVPRSQLHFIDIHLVTLRSKWTHLAVPSKAVSAISLGSTILFCGSEESDNWYLLKEAGWLINEKNEIKLQVEKILNSITEAEIKERKQNALQINQRLKQFILDSYQAVYENKF